MNLWSLPPYVQSHRAEVQVTLSRRHGIAPEPYEIRSILKEEDYQSRMNMFMGMFRKYSWSLGERIFIVVASILAVVLPVVIEQILERKFIGEAKAANALATDPVLLQAERQAFFEARSTAFGVLLGTIIFTWFPYFAWKAFGNRRLRGLLGEYNRRDSGSGYSWAIASTSLFSQTATIVITLPQFTQPTTFHPQAYLPAYMISSDQGRYPPPPGAPPVIPVAMPVGAYYEEKV